MDKSVLVAMSGGVDSSVAAYILKKQGYETAGITMKMYSEDTLGRPEEHSCCSSKDIEDAAEVSRNIGIEHIVCNFADDFKTKVMNDFAESYIRGETPNPCIECNKNIKFKQLLKQADDRGFDYISTGHYVRVKYDAASGRYLLLKGLDNRKDQSYVLYSLSQRRLSRLKFPVGELSKNEVRELARYCGLAVSDKPDSQDICFIKDGNYQGFIKQAYGYESPPGDFVDMDGNVLGRHNGLIGYTKGQRKGLGVSADRPLYVIRKDSKQNRVVLGDDGDLFSDTLTAREVNFIPFDELKSSLRVSAKIRYSQKTASCTITPDDNGNVFVKFDEPQRAITAGQSVVFYDGDVVVGGGKIC